MLLDNYLRARDKTQQLFNAGILEREMSRNDLGLFFQQDKSDPFPASTTLPPQTRIDSLARWFVSLEGDTTLLTQETHYPDALNCIRASFDRIPQLTSDRLKGIVSYVLC